VNARRLLLLIPLALVLLAPGTWYWLLHTQSGARFIWGVSVSATDDALSATSVAGDISSGVTVTGLEFRNEKALVVVAAVTATADVDLFPFSVTVTAGRASRLLIERIETVSSTEDPGDLTELLGKLQLPIELNVTDLSVDGVRLNGFRDEGIDVTSLRVVGRWQHDIALDEIELLMPQATVRGDGSLQLAEPNAVALNTQVDLQPQITGLNDTLEFELTASGPLDDLDVRATSRSPAADLSGSVAGIGDAIHWALLLEVPEFALPVATDTPALPPVQITAEGAGDLKSFTTKAQVAFRGTDMQIALSADVDIESLAIASDLHWQDAQWPVDQPEPRVSSREGRVTVTGTLDNWSVSGTVELDVPQLPGGQLSIDGRGNQDGAEVDILDGDVLGGTITGSARYSWRDPGEYSVNLDLREVHTSALLPDWPAVLSGSADISGKQQPFELSADIRNVDGVLNDKPLNASGSIDVRGTAVSVDDLRLRHGDSNVRFDGDLYSPNGLRFDISIDQLGDYVADSLGPLSASGSASLNNEKPFLRVDASSAELGYGDWQITDLVIVDRNKGDSIFDAKISAGTIVKAEFQADDFELQTSMDSESQSFDLAVMTRDISARLSIAGKLDDWQRPSSWQGEVSHINLDHPGFSAALAKPAKLFVSGERAETEQLCLAGDRGISLCTSVAWQNGVALDVAAIFSSVPVSLVNVFVDTRLNFDQLVSGEIRWQTKPDSTSTGRADIAVTPGTIVSIDRPELQMLTAQGTIGFDIEHDDLRTGKLNLPLPELGQIDAEFEVLDVADEDAMDISGKIDIDMADIAMVAAILPALDDMSGSLKADLDIAGTLTSPEVTGLVALEGGTVSYLPLGLKFQDVELVSELQGAGEIEMHGSFRAGDGTARIRTRADHSQTETRGLELRLQGNNMTVIDVPDVRAIADADIGINFDGKTLGVDGRIEIPSARIRPENIGMSRVSESGDVIIVAGELPDEPTDEVQSDDLQFEGSLEVAFGNDVLIDLDVAEATLSGSTVFRWHGEPLPTANGRYDVAGEVLAFGQQLEITEGSIRFSDVPADDPHLRIRAEREIYGNTQVRRAGVLVAGTASRPTVEAYTTPLTTEERALTLLVTGSDFDYEKGVGAVGFGTYIAPRVYASYGIGLFDTGNVIRIRYDLSRGFGITGTSGQRDSGADLSYRFEN